MRKKRSPQELTKGRNERMKESFNGGNRKGQVGKET